MLLRRSWRCASSLKPKKPQRHLKNHCRVPRKVQNESREWFWKNRFFMKFSTFSPLGPPWCSRTSENERKTQVPRRLGAKARPRGEKINFLFWTCRIAPAHPEYQQRSLRTFFRESKDFFFSRKWSRPPRKKWPRPPRKKGAAAARPNRCFSRVFHHDLRCFDLDDISEHLPGPKKLHWSAWACSQLPQKDALPHFFRCFGPVGASRRPGDPFQ